MSRTYDLYHNDHNGRLIGKYRHADFAMLAIVNLFTGYKGDELSAKHKGLMAQIEKGFHIKYQGFVDNE